MSNGAACPSVEELRRLLRGDMAELPAETVGRHMEACPRCLEAVRSLTEDDALTSGSVRSCAAHSIDHPRLNTPPRPCLIS